MGPVLDTRHGVLAHPFHNTNTPASCKAAAMIGDIQVMLFFVFREIRTRFCAGWKEPAYSTLHDMDRAVMILAQALCATLRVTSCSRPRNNVKMKRLTNTR